MKKKIKSNSKISVVLGKNVILTKVSDDHFKGNHPNGIYTGTERTGIEIVPPTIGERYWVGNFSTSIVTKIISKTLFKTLYSTYKLKYVK